MSDRKKVVLNPGGNVPHKDRLIQDSAEQDTIRGWLVCPNCGAESDKPRYVCLQCNYLSSDWGDLPNKSIWARYRKRIFLLAAFITFLLVVLAYSGYLPNPFSMISKFSSESTDNLDPGIWASYGNGPGHTRYKPVANPLVGRIKWSRTLDEEITDSEPAVVDGTVYLGGHFKVHALNAETGEHIWQFKTTGLVHSSPAIERNLVIVGLTDGKILAIDRKSGELDWTLQTGNLIVGSPTIYRGILYFGSGDKYLYSIDTATGKIFWKVHAEGRIDHAAAVFKDIVYLPSENLNLISLGARTGALRFRYSVFRNDVRDAPVAANGMVYYVTGTGMLHTIRHGTRVIPGEYQFKYLWLQFWAWGLPVPKPRPRSGVMWRFMAHNMYRGFHYAPAVAPDLLYIGDQWRWLYAIDAVKGNPVWEYKSRRPIATSPLVAGNEVYFAGKKGTLYSLNRKTGDLLWRLKLGSPPITSPIYADGVIFIRTQDGKLHAIE